MIDTLSIGTRVSGVDLKGLHARGWTVCTRQTGDRVDIKATIQDGPVRYAYLAGVAWLQVEASLPHVVKDDNSLLLSWSECELGMSTLAELAAGQLGQRVPEVAEWRVSRVDACWSWPVDPAPYVSACRVARLPRTYMRQHGTSCDWVSVGHRIRARLYDKAAEQHRPVDLPTRLERQARPRREVVKLEGKRLGCTVSDLSERVALGLVRQTLQDLGLDRPTPSILGVRQRLQEVYKPRQARALWAVLRDLQDLGGMWPADIPDRTQRSYERMLLDAGVSAFSPVGELPPLLVGELEACAA